MIQIEQIRNYFPVQIRGNSSFDKYMLKEYLQLMILDYLSSTPTIQKMVFIGGTNLRLVKGIDRFSEDLDFDCKELSKEEFVEMTNVDCLAVAFGTTHGVYLTEPKLDLPRVARLREATNIPLVMHGGSGVSDEDYAVAIENGICKVNYYTYMNTAGGKASKEYWQDDSKPLFYDSMSLVATEAIKEDVKRAIKVFQKIK